MNGNGLKLTYRHHQLKPLELLPLHYTWQSIPSASWSWSSHIAHPNQWRVGKSQNQQLHQLHFQKSSRNPLVNWLTQPIPWSSSIGQVVPCVFRTFPNDDDAYLISPWYTRKEHPQIIKTSTHPDTNSIKSHSPTSFFSPFHHSDFEADITTCRGTCRGTWCHQDLGPCWPPSNRVGQLTAAPRAGEHVSCWFWKYMGPKSEAEKYARIGLREKPQENP